MTPQALAVVLVVAAAALYLGIRGAHAARGLFGRSCACPSASVKGCGAAASLAAEIEQVARGTSEGGFPSPRPPT